MKVLLDMNISQDWETFLAEHGIEAVHWSRVGEIRAGDVEIMRYAAEHHFVVLTQDLDYGTLLSIGNLSTPSVVQLRADDIRFGVIGKATVVALRQLEKQLHAGALVTVNPTKTRLRLLPFRTDKPQF